MTNDNHNYKGSRLKRLFSSVKKLFSRTNGRKQKIKEQKETIEEQKKLIASLSSLVSPLLIEIFHSAPFFHLIHGSALPVPFEIFEAVE